MAIPNIDLQSPQQYTKDQVNYRHYEACRTCANFNGRVGCSKVQGHVSPDGTCTQWTMQEPEQLLTQKELIMG